MNDCAGRDGFTLLETLIAFLIISVALGISAHTTAIASKSMSLAAERQEAVRIAQSVRAEILTAKDRQDHETGKHSEWNWALDKVAGETDEKAAGFRRLTLTSPRGGNHTFLFFLDERPAGAFP